MRIDRAADCILGYLEVSSYFRNSEPRLLSSHFLLTNRRWKAEPFRTKKYDTSQIQSIPNPHRYSSETQECNPAPSSRGLLSGATGDDGLLVRNASGHDVGTVRVLLIEEERGVAPQTQRMHGTSQPRERVTRPGSIEARSSECGSDGPRGFHANRPTLTDASTPWDILRVRPDCVHRGEPGTGQFPGRPVRFTGNCSLGATPPTAVGQTG